MSQEPVSARKGAKAPRNAPTTTNKDSVEESTDGTQIGSNLDRTEAFSMSLNAEDNIADFLLGNNDDVDAADLEETDIAGMSVPVKKRTRTAPRTARRQASSRCSGHTGEQDIRAKTRSPQT